MTACIVVQGERRVSVASYLAVVQCAKANPERMFKASLRHWAPSPGRVIVREFRDGLHEKISRRMAHYGVGRKWGQEWQTETLRAALNLNTPRLRFYWLPAWLRPRFEHRISHHDD